MVEYVPRQILLHHQQTLLFRTDVVDDWQIPRIELVVNVDIVGHVDLVRN